MAELLWRPSRQRVEQAEMTRFIRFVNDKYGRDFHVYPELYEWSITNIGEFWEAMWEFGGIIASKGYDRVVDNPDQMPGAKWFPGARLNFAENLLRHDDDRPALIFRSETGWTRRLSFAELREEVARLAKSLKEMGVEPGDRVAGFMPNLIETVTAMLAAASLGAIWSSCSPDFGFSGIIDRFGQIEPKVLFTADGYFYNGKRFDSLERAGRVARGIPSIERLVVVPYTVEEVDLESVPKAVSLDDFRFPQRGLQPEFEQLPFDHPVYILYSSGTTGVPKCIVHGGGGTLIQHLKEHMLHADLKPSEQLFYFTTCGWMMWNWMVSCLAVGAAAVLFDGSPMYPDPGALWQLSEDESVNVFGTSARYLAALEKSGAKPGEEYDLTWLKAILSTASPLSAEQFKWVYANIKQDLCLSSISGGTDIVSCFAGGNPIGPVYAGQLQAPGLGMAVEAWDETGRPVWGEKGELVCTKPFPSMPVSFWNDPDGEKYRKAYFDKFPGVWAHGDFCEMTHEGGVIIHGRSDATLNPGGVRIGTAEIYRQVETMPEVNDCLVVGQQWQNDERVILFVKPAEGVTLDDDLVKRIKQNIRSDTSPRHVPAKILQVSDIPYTRSGKKVEMAVRKVIHGRPVQNREALANPQALELYAGLEELSR